MSYWKFYPKKGHKALLFLKIFLILSLLRFGQFDLKCPGFLHLYNAIWFLFLNSFFSLDSFLAKCLMNLSFFLSMAWNFLYIKDNSSSVRAVFIRLISFVWWLFSLISYWWDSFVVYEGYGLAFFYKQKRFIRTREYKTNTNPLHQTIETENFNLYHISNIPKDSKSNQSKIDLNTFPPYE